MTSSMRPWWQNCALNTDAEIAAIDAMEDRLVLIDENAVKIRELIATFELCHHKSNRWIRNICEAIGSGETTKGLGSRSTGKRHPRENVWEDACDVLSAWCAGCPVTDVDLYIDTVPATQLLACLGERSPLREWQVQRVVGKIRSVIDWARFPDNPESQYVWLLLSAGEYESAYVSQCPDAYEKEEKFWLKTVRTLIHDTENGDAADLSLALAIDMLWPCHWGFVDNLRIVLEAIGGKLDPQVPFSACGRNISLFPNRGRMATVCATLRALCGDPVSSRDVDDDLMELLGPSNELKQWLGASLEKTIRLQLNPPDDLRQLSALTGPEWIHRYP